MPTLVANRATLRSIWVYLAWTFGISWGAWYLLIFWAERDNYPFLTQVIFTLGAISPAIATKITLKIPIDEYGHFIFSAKKGTWIHLVVLMVFQSAILFFSSSGPDPSASIFSISGIFIYTLLCGGGAEEPGWRGFLQPTLEKYFPFATATFFTGTLWALWHFPLWILPNTNQYTIPFLSFLVSAIIFSFIQAGLYKKSHSVIYCALFHSFYNVAAGFIPAHKPSMVSTIILGYMMGYATLLWWATDRTERTGIIITILPRRRSRNKKRKPLSP